jgi:hypothetical protein
MAKTTLPPPIPGLTNTSMSQMVRESGVIASAFAEDFEKLMESYKITEYKLKVKSDIFELDIENNAEEG